MIGEPSISFREERLTMGIRATAPFRGMFAVQDELLQDLRRWAQTHGLAEEAPYFLGYHVIDMNHHMAIEGVLRHIHDYSIRRHIR